MRKIIIILAAMAILMTLMSCSESAGAPKGDPNSEGIIFGEDLRKCMCCSGWLIDINHDTLRIQNMPSDFEAILRTKTLPVKVNIDWEKLTGGCAETLSGIIVVKSISLK